MDSTQGKECVYWGRLPERAPLVNPYVPFQLDNPQTYPKGKALVRGTLYPGLDLPFMGMVNRCEKKKTPMTNLQEIGFALTELALYLDTHRDDREALEMYRNVQCAYRDAAKQYAMECGPLNHLSEADGNEYTWLRDPWPWEYAANRGYKYVSV